MVFFFIPLQESEGLEPCEFSQTGKCVRKVTDGGRNSGKTCPQCFLLMDRSKTKAGRGLCPFGVGGCHVLSGCAFCCHLDLSRYGDSNAEMDTSKLQLQSLWAPLSKSRMLVHLLGVKNTDDAPPAILSEMDTGDFETSNHAILNAETRSNGAPKITPCIAQRWSRESRARSPPPPERGPRKPPPASRGGASSRSRRRSPSAPGPRTRM